VLLPNKKEIDGFFAARLEQAMAALAAEDLDVFDGGWIRCQQTGYGSGQFLSYRLRELQHRQRTKKPPRIHL
jgi:hypothetical protein